MKRMLTIFLCLLFLALCTSGLGESWLEAIGAAAYGGNDSSIRLRAEASAAVNVSVDPQDPNVLAQYKLVLDNEQEFIDTSSNSNRYLEQLISGFDGLPVAFSQFAVIDLDADGTAEVVVKLTVNGSDYGYEILSLHDGAIYGYDIVYRAFMELKMDGTFSYASSAFDTGFGTLVFDENGYTVNAIAGSEATDSGSVQYASNGAAITEADYMQLQDEQASKPDVDWLDFTEANIEQCFGE